MADHDSDANEYKTGSEDETEITKRPNPNPKPKKVVTKSTTPTNKQAEAEPKPLVEQKTLPPPGPWGDRGVTSPTAGTKKPPQKDSSLNVRINLDLRADVALELHAVIQGDITIGLF